MALQWATTAAVRDRWIGPGPDATDTQIATLLEDAESLIRREFPDIQERIDAGELEPRTVAAVAARAVIRVLRNPEGTRSTSEGAGPFQRQTTYAGDLPGELFLTDDDRAALGGTKARRAFQIDGTPRAVRNGGYWQAPDLWVPAP